MKHSLFIFNLAWAACLFIAPVNGAAEIHPFNSKKLTLVPVFEAAEIYDDNITFTKTNKRRDFITELTAGLNADYESRKHYLDFYGEIVQQLFIDNTDFSNNAQSGRLAYLYEISDQQSIRAEDRFSHYEEPRSFDDEFGRDNGRYDRARNTFKLTYAQEFNERLSAETFYGNEFNLFSRESLRDSLLNRAGTDLNYSFSSATMVSVGYEFIHRVFESSGGSPSSSVSTHGITTGVRRYLTKNLYLDGRAGVDLIKPDTSDLNIEPRFTISLNADVGKLSTIQFFKFEKRSSVNSFRNEVFEYWQISAGGFRQLRERLTGGANAFYGNGEYTPTGIEDNLYGFNTYMEYEISEDLSVNLSYSLSITDSNIAFREYVKNQASLKFAYAF